MLRNLLFMTFSLALLLPTTAVAQTSDSAVESTGGQAKKSPSPASILEQVDAVANQAEDFKAEVHIVTNEPSGKTTEREMTVWQKGAEKRMLKLSGPARLKGVSMLATDDDQHYMYLPSFKRVRRVAGQRRGQPFLGSNFTQDDMVRTGYGRRFTAQLVKQDGENWFLRLTPKQAKKEPYHHLDLTVRKKDFVVSKVRVFEDADEAAREIVAGDVKTVGEIPIAHEIVATDLSNGSKSTAKLSGVEVDTGLKDSFFSKRYMTR